MKVGDAVPARDRWLVAGASGLVGGEMVRALRASGRYVRGAARSILGEATVAVDLADRDGVARLVATEAPSVVVIASAWPYVDGCELDPARSHHHNVETVENVVRALGDTNVRIVFYSTDHVFDGRKPGAYVEDDDVTPLSVYAKHKREVEEVLLARGRSLIVRTAWVFGEELRQKNFVYRVAGVARAGETLKVPSGQSGCPTWAGWLAETTRSLVESSVEGVVHATGTEEFTKAEWATVIAKTLGLPKLDVVEMTPAEAGQVAPRPDRVVLESTRHGFRHPDVRSVLTKLGPRF